MTIPEWDSDGLIPPIRPGTREEDETEPTVRSPYEATVEQLVDRFAISQERAILMLGFLDYRAALYQVGITSGFQWVNGSFMEEIELSEEDPSRTERHRRGDVLLPF